VLLDANGGNPPAVAAVVKLQQAAGDVQGHRAVITAGTGPVGVRAAGLLARGGADVIIPSRRPEQNMPVIEQIRQRFGGSVRAVALADGSQANAVLEGA